MDTAARLRSLIRNLTQTIVPWRLALPTALVLAALAVAGNSMGIGLFINARLTFGTVFVVFAVGLLGAPWALLVGAAATVAAGFYWGYPVLAIPFALEAIWMGALYQPDRNNAVVRIGAFWVALGAPLALFFSGSVLGVDISGAGLFAITRILNGLLNALIAELLIRATPRIPALRRHYRLEDQHTLENLLLSVMIGLILIPALIIVTSGARAMRDSAERVVRGELQLTARSFSRSMSGWFDENYQSIRSLARSATTHHRELGHFEAMGPELELLKYADADFLVLALFDPDGEAVHMQPSMEPPPEGKDALMATKEEIMRGASLALSGVFPMKAIGRTTRAVVLAAPVRDTEGSLVAIAAGILDAASVHSHLESTRGQRNIAVSVHDHSGQALSRSDGGGARSFMPRLPSTSAEDAMKSGLLVDRFGSGITRVDYPASSRGYALDIDGGYYQLRMPLESYPGWTVQVTRSLDQTMEELVQRDIAALLLTFAVVFVVGLFAVYFSRSIVSSISALKLASNEATRKITKGQVVPWPRSHVREVSLLSENFQEMSKELRASFADLREAKQRAEEASMAKSRFLQNVSHELRTPLNGILGFAQILDRDENLPADYRDAVQGILQSGNDLLRFIKDLLIHAKIDSQHLQLSPREIRLPDTVAGVADTVRPSAEAKRLGFSVELDESLPRIIRVDEKRLQQVLYNLLTNAVAYTESGSIALRVSRVDENRVCFAVSDTGPGIPEDEIDALFSPLRQLERHPQARGGTGLGLSIVKRLVVMMGGSIDVDSTLGLGSTFRVTLPLHAGNGQS